MIWRRLGIKTGYHRYSCYIRVHYTGAYVNNRNHTVAYDIYIDEDINCVSIRHYGDFVLGEFAQALIAAADNIKYQEGMNFLRDARLINMPPELNFKQYKNFKVRGLTETHTKIGGVKLAWLAGNRNDFIILHQILVSHRLDQSMFDRKAFRNMEKAKEWLGIEPSYEIAFSESEICV